MAAYPSFKDHFLIAMPSLLDPNFAHSVTYICEHTEQGAMGIIINFPLTIHLGDILENMNIHPDDAQIAQTLVFAGGPVQQERGFVIHRPLDKDWQTSLKLNDDVFITTSKDILEAIAHHEGPSQAIVALGYAGWMEGQLEKEISENSWLCAPADPNIMFEVPFQDRWRAAAAGLGVDVDHLSVEVGHS